MPAMIVESKVAYFWSNACISRAVFVLVFFYLGLGNDLDTYEHEKEN